MGLLNVLEHRNQLIGAGGVFLANRVILIAGILGAIGQAQQGHQVGKVTFHSSDNLVPIRQHFAIVSIAKKPTREQESLRKVH